ncbi:S-layer homology domain-containing protein [Brevibacillus ruminantium]|uniref:S-layer homology domain-containing protein n=1 Tax=Brevibacillus ruminantium TaxID=2950604 RepID=A0ABY4WM85_9BACL|nr:S-layer homology domain-containing protein [Brevibacillus ruminantium]USG66955.1 S-layer homology domain-containing protein [Brevibacillus ruminantium]
MTRRKQSWGMIAGLSTAVLLTSFAAPSGYLAGGTAVFAAEAGAKSLSREEAVKKAEGYVAIPAGYKLERASYLDPATEGPFNEPPSWQVSWEKGSDSRIFMSIDAQTGQLLRFYQYTEELQSGSGKTDVGEEKALSKAEEFLKKVTAKEEIAKLSKPNEFAGPSPFFSAWGEYGFSFTRIENDIPFLENGITVVVSNNGEVVRYDRMWNTGTLPSPKDVLDQEEAEKRMAELIGPSLVYVDKAFLTGRYEQDRGKYQLVYRYQEHDPQFLDAHSGKPLNQLGLEATESSLKPLGTTVRKSANDDQVITKEEAQKIADQVIKLLPGSYRSEGNRGSGSSSGPDGIERRNWSFEYTPLHIQGKNVDKVELRISDRGQLIEYSSKDRFYNRETNRKIEKAVPYEKSVESATQLVKALLSDQLGEIYLINRPPLEKLRADQLERGKYDTILFGKMKDGIPIEDADFEVIVNPETGEAESLNFWRREHVNLEEQAKAKIDREAAKKAEQENKQVKLTYYLPQGRYFGGVLDNSNPLLVYRYVGDSGYVDAHSGEWVNLKKQQPEGSASDIADHPNQEDLQFAIRQGLLTVTDGKVEPDKEVTRGEAAAIWVRLMDRIEFHYQFRSFRSDDDEARQPYRFEDVDAKHPLYNVIQKGVQAGVIAKEGKRFEPDRAITRAEAADLVARLLGYGDLLDKTEIFNAPYKDVPKQSVPAAALVHAHGLLSESGKGSFDPNGTLTRAEMAKLIKQLLELKKENK